MSEEEKMLINKISLASRQFAIDFKDFSTTLDLFADTVNAVVHLNTPEALGLTYINQQFLEKHEIDLDFLKANSVDFLNHIVSDQTVSNVFPLIFDYLEEGDYQKNLNVIQDYQGSKNSDYVRYFSTINFNQQINKFICIDFELNELESGFNTIKGIVDITKEKEKKYPLFKSLTRRELEILVLISLGYSNTQIGDQLFISSHTVRTHRNNIYRKLGLKNLRDVIYFAELFDLIKTQ